MLVGPTTKGKYPGAMVRQCRAKQQTVDIILENTVSTLLVTGLLRGSTEKE